MIGHTKLVIPLLLASCPVWAYHDGWGHGRGYYGYNRFEHGRYWNRSGPGGYYMPPPVQYMPAYPVQPRAYYPPQPRYYGYAQPAAPQGMMGGMVGSAVGYQLSNGNPVASGIGAAAGAMIGNGMYR